MSDPLVIEPTIQIDSWDCGVSCLVMLTGKSMGEVRAAVPAYVVKRKEGLGSRQMQTIAARLGIKTRWIKDGDLQEIVGILGLNRENGKDGHYVMVLKGVLYNPAENRIWTDIESFLTTRRWRPAGVLVRED